MTKIIAEVAQAHDGSLGNAYRFIDAVADVGADAVKFQYRIPGVESTASEKFKPHCFHPQDKSRLEYCRRVDLSHYTSDLMDHAQRVRGIQFGLSVFSSYGVFAVLQYPRKRVDFLKIPAGEWDNNQLFSALRNFQLSDVVQFPVFMSWGMLTEPWQLRWKGVDVIPMACLSSYPHTPELSPVDQVCRQVGLSDHSGSKWPAIAATMRGAPAVEVHVCWSKRQFGFDVSSSVTIDELAEICDFKRAAASYVDWDTHGVCELPRTNASYVNEVKRKAHKLYRLGRPPV